MVRVTSMRSLTVPLRLQKTSELGVCVVLVSGLVRVFPVQFSFHPSHIAGANPVCGSTFKVLAAFARVSA